MPTAVPNDAVAEPPHLSETSTCHECFPLVRFVAFIVAVPFDDSVFVPS